MAELLANCPRCGAAKTTFDLLASVVTRVEYEWQHHHEAFCVCRHCARSTVFHLADQEPGIGKVVRAQGGVNAINGSVNQYFKVLGFISQKDGSTIAAPEHLPGAVRSAFEEGALCLAVGCFNAAGTMFRLAVDLATKELLPADNTNGLNSLVRRNLGLRLPWLFDNGLLPEALRDLSTCIKDDGNDGAHTGSLQKRDAEDLIDFTTALLERIYTEPERLRQAKARRDARNST